MAFLRSATTMSSGLGWLTSWPITRTMFAGGMKTVGTAS